MNPLKIKAFSVCRYYTVTALLCRGSHQSGGRSQDGIGESGTRFRILYAGRIRPRYRRHEKEQRRQNAELYFRFTGIKKARKQGVKSLLRAFFESGGGKKWGIFCFRQNDSPEKSSIHAGSRAFPLVEVTGFEPATSCSQSRRATNCATPRYSFVFVFMVLIRLFRALCFGRPLAVPASSCRKTAA